MSNHVSSVAPGHLAAVNGLELYYEIHGTGRPLILLHGGFGVVGMFERLLPALAETRQVIGVELQGHGHTADIDRPLRCETMADDVAALIRHLGLGGEADVLGYSLGAGVALQTAIRHPALVRKLVVISVPFRSDGSYPEVRAAMAGITAESAAGMIGSPMHTAYMAVAPRPDDFPLLAEKTGELLRLDYDWSAEVSALRQPILLVYADADSVSPAYAAEAFALLGGGQRDAGWEGTDRPTSQLAILPGTTHYNLLDRVELLAPMIEAFLAD